MLDYKFDKQFFPEKELLKVIPVKRSTFFAWQSEWISKGKDPKEMGKLVFKNKSKSKRFMVYWNAPVFLKWMLDNKLDQESKTTSVIAVVNKFGKEDY